MTLIFAFGVVAIAGCRLRKCSDAQCFSFGIVLHLICSLNRKHILSHYRLPRLMWMHIRIDWHDIYNHVSTRHPCWPNRFFRLSLNVLFRTFTYCTSSNTRLPSTLPTFFDSTSLLAGTVVVFTPPIVSPPRLSISFLSHLLISITRSTADTAIRADSYG